MTQSFRCFEGKAQPGEPFWTFRAVEETGGEAEVEFFGIISEWSWLDDDISPKKFKDELMRMGNGGPVTVRIDSPGGDPIAASAIASIIAGYPGQVTAQIEGQASSSAVVVALAASRVRIMDSAYMMIHDPKVNVFMAALDVETMKSLIAALESVKAGMVQSYAARTGQDTEKVAKMMTATTWMSAQEAIDLHFADEIVPAKQKKRARQFESLLKTYEHVPAALLNMADDQPDEGSQAAPGGAEGEPAEPGTQERPDPLAGLRQAIASKKDFPVQGETMYIRELIAQRAALVAEAEALIAKADGESRDLTAEERARFEALLGAGDTPGEIAALDARIEAIEADRAKLRAAAEKKFSAQAPVKPEPPAPGKIMKRGEFEALSVAEQAAFMRGGGKLED
jgi:ATP-dependent Clp protease protease subunit